MKRLKYLLVALFPLLAWEACEKDVKPDVSGIQVETKEPTETGRTYITLNGRMSTLSSVTETGVVWWKNGEELNSSEIVCNETVSENIHIFLENLDPAESYEYYFYASNGVNRQTSETNRFSTLSVGKPLVSELVVDEKIGNRFTAVIKDDGVSDTGTHIIRKGICWNTESNPTLEDASIESIEEGSYVRVSIPDLKENTSYYLRAFAENDSAYFAYGPEFKIMTGKTLPAVGEVAVLDTLKKQFQSSVLDPGGSEILFQGFCWNTTGMPTVADPKEEADDRFCATLGALHPDTLYHIRAFAQNAYGIAYGDELDIQIGNIPQLGQVERAEGTTNTFRSSILVGDEGKIIRKGFCWNTTGRPTLDDQTISADENFVATLSDLTEGTYYIRAFAINEFGIGYSSELSVTIWMVTLPQLGEIRRIDSEANLFQSSVIEEGGSKILSQGFCWSTHDTPTVSDHVVPADEYFTATLPSWPNGTYYVRAFAANSAGVGYSPTMQVNVGTEPVLGEIQVLDEEKKLLRCTIVDDGGSPIKVQGFCWTKDAIPTIDDFVATADEFFTVTLQNLEIGTYYVRAFATNAIGTGYSITFVLSVSSHTFPF